MKKIIRVFFYLLFFLFFVFLTPPQKALAIECSGKLFQVTFTPSPPIPETSTQVNIIVSPLNDTFNPKRTYKIQLLDAKIPLYEEKGLSPSGDNNLYMTITPQKFRDFFYYSAFNKDGLDLKVFVEPNELICSGIKIPISKPGCSLSALWNQDFSMKVGVSGYTGRDTQGNSGTHIAIQKQTGCPPIKGCSIVPYNIQIQNGGGIVTIPTVSDPAMTIYKIVLTTAGNMSDESCSAEITKLSNPPISPSPGTTPTPSPSGPCPGLTEPELTKCTDCIEGRDPATQGKPGAYTALGCISTDPSGFVAWLLQKVIGIAGGIAFLLILFGGFQILTSAGNPEKLASGKDIVVSAIAGLLMIVFSVLLLRVIGYDILQIPDFITK